MSSNENKILGLDVKKVYDKFNKEELAMAIQTLSDNMDAYYCTDVRIDLTKPEAAESFC